jgi:hypothetical protein
MRSIYKSSPTTSEEMMGLLLGPALMLSYLTSQPPAVADGQDVDFFVADESLFKKKNVDVSGRQDAFIYGVSYEVRL